MNERPARDGDFKPFMLAHARHRLRSSAPELVFGGLVFVFLMLHPWLNGYPFLFPDSYGYYGLCPDELRSPVLGCALRPVTAVLGPWAYIAVQSAVTALALAYLWGTVLKRQYTAAMGVALAVSGLGLFSGWLMADVWILIALIGLFAIAAGHVSLFTALLLAFSCSTHFGNFPIIAAAALMMAPTVRHRLKYASCVGLCLLGGMALIVAFNLLGGQFRLTSGNGSLFLASRVLHDMPQVLERQCEENPEFTFCLREKELIAWSAENHQSFTWTAIYNLGLEWVVLNRLSKEFLIYSVRGSPRFRVDHAVSALRNTGTLIFFPELANGLEPFDSNSIAASDLRSCYPGEVDDYLGSWQARGVLQPFLRALETPVLVLVWLALAVCLLGAAVGWRSLRDDPLIQMALFALIAVFANAFCMSFLSGVFGRYQIRILFILIFPAAALMLRWVSRRVKIRLDIVRGTR